MIQNLSQIDLLVESGLAPIKKLPYARIVLGDVPQGITSMVYRDLAIEIFSKITDHILNDSILYQRLRQLLMQESPMSSRAFEALITKAEKASIPLDVVIEVYNRGYADNPGMLSHEQHAFNRVNSFIAGGLARQWDADLLDEMELEAKDREEGSDSLVKTYQQDTPGEPGYKKTLNTIRKVLKK